MSFKCDIYHKVSYIFEILHAHTWVVINVLTVLQKQCERENERWKSLKLFMKFQTSKKVVSHRCFLRFLLEEIVENCWVTRRLKFGCWAFNAGCKSSIVFIVSSNYTKKYLDQKYRRRNKWRRPGTCTLIFAYCCSFFSKQLKFEISGCRILLDIGLIKCLIRRNTDTICQAVTLHLL